MSTIIRLLVLSFFATSLLLFPPSAYAQEQPKEAPKILYQVNGKISSGCCTKEGYKPAEYTALGENVSWGTSQEDLGWSASTAGSAGDGSYSITHVAKMDDPGGLLADFRISPAWRKYGYDVGEYTYGASLRDEVKIFVRQGSASRYSITQTDSGSLKGDGNNHMMVGAYAYGNQKSWTAGTTWDRNRGRHGNPEASASFSRRTVKRGQVSCSSGPYSFLEYPSANYCLIYAESTQTGVGQYDDVYSFGHKSNAEAYHTATIKVSTDFLREPKPGKGCYTCPCPTPLISSGPITVSSYGGNASFGILDPVLTRGYPLKNAIHLNTQAIEFDRGMGNATFSYDIHVAKDLKLNSDGTLAPHWLLVDGDGARLDYGPVSSDPTPEQGAYGKLLRIENGFELTEAGSPEEIGQAGNFRYLFDTDGKLLELIDASGNRQTLTYETAGKLTQVLDKSSKRAIAFEYEGNRIVRVVENGRGAITYLSYTDGKLASVRIENGQGKVARSTAVTYNSAGLPETFIFDGDENSAQKLTYSLAPSIDPDRPVSLVTAIQSGKETTTITYDLDPALGVDQFPQGQQPGVATTKVTNSKGGTTYYNFDERGDLVWVGLPPVNQEKTPRAQRLFYSNNHQLTFFLKPNGLAITFSYYPNGLIQQKSDNGVVQRYFYSGVDLVKIEDAMGSLVELGYTDSRLPHSPTTLKDGNGNIWRFTYNTFGQLTSMIPPEGSPQGTTSIEYWEDEASPFYGYPKAIVDGSGVKASFDGYNSLGDLTSWSSPTSTTNMIFDALHRIVEAKYKNGSTQQWLYNGQFLASTIDELGNKYDYEFCAACNGLEKISGPLKWSLKWIRDKDQDVTSFIDAREKETKYEYGLARELSKVIYPDASYLAYAYDSVGRVKETINSRGIKETRTYRWTGVPAIVSYSDKTPSISYRHNSDGTPLAINENGQFHNYDYYPNRLIKSETYANQAIAYTYYPDNLLKTVTWKNGTTEIATWQYSYDSSGRVKSVSSSFGESVSYQYDGEGRLLEQKNSNGTSTRYTYKSDRGWLTRIEQFRGKQSFTSFAISRDKAGKITTIKEGKDPSRTFTYDKLSRLLSEKQEGGVVNRFTYDRAGNIAKVNDQEFATYDSANKIATLTQGSVNHDADGNILNFSKAGLPSGQFTWDAQNRMTSQQSGTELIKYGFFGRTRISAEKNGKKTLYVYDGDRLIGEVVDGVPTRAYTWGADGLVSQRDLSGSKSTWYHFGPQGETRQLTDADGAIADTYTYTAYGDSLTATSNTTNPFRYVGKYGCYTEGNAGLILCGARWYSPQLMRWLSKDPIEYLGGANIYGYVEADPVNSYDSTGLNPLIVFGRNPILLRPAPGSGGAHSTFSRNSTGQINRWAGWKPNPRNPSGFDEIKRFDLDGKGHFNKCTKENIPTPHVHDPITPGGIRSPNPREIPGSPSGINSIPTFQLSPDYWNGLPMS